MDRPTFLNRHTLGIPNYLVVALLAVLLVAAVPRGARKALETNTNKVEDWLPSSYTESQELAWFRQQFGSEAFVLVSWEGCTLGQTEQLRLLAGKLAKLSLPESMARTAKVSPHADRRVFSRIVTGPQLISRLTDRPARLTRSQAIARLEGVFVGPPGADQSDASRTTCLVAYLSPEAQVNNRTMRMAIGQIETIAHDQCGIEPEELHMGGPPVDNVSIDIEGERTLLKLAGLSGLVGLVLAYVCFRSIRLTAMVLMVAVISAGASLAIVYYFGAFEVLALGASSPRLGKLDAILMSMPAVVYVLALSGAIHMVNYYRDAVEIGGRRGAVERSVRMALLPCGLAAFTTAIGLASLASSDILPIEKFGVFSAIGVLLTVVLLFTTLSVALHRFAPPVSVPNTNASNHSLPAWARSATQFVCRRHGWISLGAGSLMLLFALGLPRIESSVKLIKLLHPESDLVQDYTWLESHLGHLIPMEVVIAVPSEFRRGVNDHPEHDGQRYAMTTIERLKLVRRIGDQIEQLAPVSRTLTAATFAPSELDSRSPSNRRTHDYILSEAIDENREDFAEFLGWEQWYSTQPSGPPRELWRASARVAALEDIDYGQFVNDLRGAVQPVLSAYDARNQLVAALATENNQLAGSRICLVTSTQPTSTERLLAALLRESGVATVFGGQRGQLQAVSTSQLQAFKPDKQRQLAERFIIVAIEPEIAESLQQLELSHKNLSNSVVQVGDSVFSGEPTQAGIQAVYTGVMPVVYKTQRQLLVSLQESLAVASLLIACVLIVLLRSIGGGLATMIPNLFPLVVVFGGLGWLSISVDIGIMMTASVALGVAVDDTIHFVSWFRRGIHIGLSRHDAAMLAYERCATAMVQTTLIAGLGLAVFAASAFTPTQQFGYLMVTILAAALVGDLVLLPALLVGPIGALFPAARTSPPIDSPRLTQVKAAAQAETTNSSPASLTAAKPRHATLAIEALATRPDVDVSEDEASDGDDSVADAPPTEHQVAPEATELLQRPAKIAPPHSSQSTVERHTDSDALSPTNAALRAKLRRFRRTER